MDTRVRHEREPRIFRFEVSADGGARPGLGVIAAWVAGETPGSAVVALACDPNHDPGRPIMDMVPAAIGYLLTRMEDPAESPCWTVIDAMGRYCVALPQWPDACAPEGTAAFALPEVSYRRFSSGLGVDAFLRETGAAGEAALEMLSAACELPGTETATPSMLAFLDAVESHGDLPIPLFPMVEDAANKGDIKKAASLVQSDPLISRALINYANAARFAGADKTDSVHQAVVRLGMVFVQRVVFVAAMMMRHQKGHCAEFNYNAYWMNALATGAAMRALLPEFEIPESMADDAHAIGLVSDIGWLAVAETYPALMTRYLQRCRGKDPLPKIRLQNETFPCPIRLVSERYLECFSFPDLVQSAVAGRSAGHHRLLACLTRARRIAQSLAPLPLLAVLPASRIPPACREEWERWQSLATGASTGESSVIGTSAPIS